MKLLLIIWMHAVLTAVPTSMYLYSSSKLSCRCPESLVMKHMTGNLSKATKNVSTIRYSVSVIKVGECTHSKTITRLGSSFTEFRL